MSEEAFCVQMVGQLGRVLELIGWFQAVIVVTATTSFIPDFVSDIIYSPLSPLLRFDLVASVYYKCHGDLAARPRRHGGGRLGAAAAGGLRLPGQIEFETAASLSDI